MQAFEAAPGVAPSAEARALYERLARGEGAAHPPAPATACVGRAAELRAPRGCPGGETGSRPLNLIGPGGAHKARLTLASAGAVLDAFPHGVFFVPLAPLSAGEQMYRRTPACGASRWTIGAAGACSWCWTMLSNCSRMVRQCAC